MPQSSRRRALQAEDAAEQVTVEYEELPTVVTIEAATAKNAPQIWPDAPGNIAAQTEFGDKKATDAAFAKAKHVTKLSFYNQRLVPVSMEPRGSAAEFDQASGRVTLFTSCQNPAGLQKTLAEDILKVPMDKVRVRVGDVGGGFGMKTMLYPEDAVCAYAARKLGRPVCWRATRSEEFLAGTHGRDQNNEAELAFDADGKILGFRVNIVGNVGAYGCSPGAVIVVAIGPKVITGVYHIPALHLRGTAVLTHTNLVSAYRGAGRPEAIYLVERLMDQAAAEMKMDPAELRRRNFIQPAQMPYTTPMGETFDSGNFPHMLNRILEHADWKGFDKRKQESKARGKLRGRALSTFLEWTGVVHEETIDLHVEADGTVKVYTAMQAMGQGIETSYVQIISATLGIDPERIVIVQGDSDIAQGLGSMGSRSLYIGGSAMLTASEQTIEKGRELAADELEAAAGDIQYQDGRFKVAGTDLGVGLFDLAGKQPEKRIAIKTLQTVGGPSWPNSCHVCEVEVDPDTGEVADRQVHDGGRRRPRDQPADRRRPGARRHRPGGRSGAAGERPLRPRERPAAHRLADGLLRAARGQPAEHRHLHRRDHAVQDQSARRQGRGRAGHGGRHADGDQRAHRRAAAARGEAASRCPRRRSACGGR